MRNDDDVLAGARSCAQLLQRALDFARMIDIAAEAVVERYRRNGFMRPAAFAKIRGEWVQNRIMIPPARDQENRRPFRAQVRAPMICVTTSTMIAISANVKAALMNMNRIVSRSRGSEPRARCCS